MILLVGKGFWEWYTDLTEPVAGKRCILLSNHKHLVSVGSPGGINSKVSTCQCRRHKRCRFDPWVRKIPWRRKWQIPQKRKWQPTLVFLPWQIPWTEEPGGSQSMGVTQSQSRLSDKPTVTRPGSAAKAPGPYVPREAHTLGLGGPKQVQRNYHS